jgi:hypothetical protein
MYVTASGIAASAEDVMVLLVVIASAYLLLGIHSNGEAASRADTTGVVAIESNRTLVAGRLHILTISFCTH